MSFVCLRKDSHEKALENTGPDRHHPRPHVVGPLQKWSHHGHERVDNMNSDVGGAGRGLCLRVLFPVPGYEATIDYCLG